MTKSLVTSVLLKVMIAAGSLEIGKGLINAFSFDIFGKCVTGEYGPTSNMCQYGPQISINLLSALIFLGVSLVLLNNTGTKITKQLISKVGALSFIFFWMLTFVWRFQLSLQDNFFLSGGPETFTEYMFVLFVWLDVVLVGIALGVIAWAPGAINRTSKDPAKRKEPRIKFVAPKKK